MCWKFYAWAAAAITGAIVFGFTGARMEGPVSFAILAVAGLGLFFAGVHSHGCQEEDPAQETDQEEATLETYRAAAEDARREANVAGHQTYRPELDDLNDNPHAAVLKVIRERSGNPRVIADLTKIPDHIVATTLAQLATAGLIRQNDPRMPWFAVDDVLPQTVASTSDV